MGRRRSLSPSRWRRRCKALTHLKGSIGSSRLIIVKAVVGALSRRASVVRRLQQHQRVTSTVRRQHDAEEACENDERPVRLLFQRCARVLARPFHGAGEDDWIGHSLLPGCANARLAESTTAGLMEHSADGGGPRIGLERARSTRRPRLARTGDP